jgi:hypothetical protein
VWQEVIAGLGLHGVQMETTAEERTIEAEVYRIDSPEMEPRAFEGRARVQGTPVVERRKVRLPKGSVRVSTDQPLGDLAAILLEPGSTDSYFQWGFFMEILQETEYVESYVMEPMAERMMAQDEALRREFEAKVASDSAFAASPDARVRWFYRRTPYADDRWRIYPVVREAAVGSSE